MNGNISTELLQALVTASAEQQASALKILRGETADPLPDAEPYLTLKQVSAKLNFHPSTLWRWGVPKHSLGGRPRFLLSEVRAYVDSPEFQKKAKALKLNRQERRKVCAVGGAS